MLKHRLTSDEYQRIEVITGTARRRRWSTAEKLRIVEGEEDKERPQRGVSLTNLDSRESVSSVARRNGVAPNLLYRWRRL
ncbi:MAG: transposase, partial [Pseudomonadota bacterium]